MNGQTPQLRGAVATLPPRFETISSNNQDSLNRTGGPLAQSDEGDPPRLVESPNQVSVNQHWLNHTNFG
jgi:hypothetical protein